MWLEMKNCFFVFLSVFCFCPGFDAFSADMKAPGKTVKIHSGKIISAQVSSKSVQVKNLSKFRSLTNVPEKKRLYALVFVKLETGRSISIYDYVLSDGISSSKCKALNKNGGNFDASEWVYKSASPEDVYSMLFILNRAELKEKFIKYKFLPRLFAGKEVELLFSNRGKAPFLMYDKIPPEGNIGKVMLPKPKPKPKLQKTTKKKKAPPDKKKAPSKKEEAGAKKNKKKKA
jgi:hypothetical protein